MTRCTTPLEEKCRGYAVEQPRDLEAIVELEALREEIRDVRNGTAG
jgi:hypothetical protein